MAKRQVHVINPAELWGGFTIFAYGGLSTAETQNLISLPDDYVPLVTDKNCFMRQSFGATRFVSKRGHSFESELFLVDR